MADEDQLERRDTSLERLVFFSDGVFAIAITLLVLDLGVPNVPEAGGAPELGGALWDLAPAVFAYALSFLVIGLYWQGHRRVFAHIVRGDVVLTWLNLVYLMLIAFLPFPTAVRGEYENARSALVFYAATHVAIGVVSVVLWLYATSSRRLVRDDLPRQVVRTGIAANVVPPAVFLVSIAVAFIDHDLAPLIWVGLALAEPVRKVLSGR